MDNDEHTTWAAAKLRKSLICSLHLACIELACDRAKLINDARDMQDEAKSLEREADELRAWADKLRGAP